MSKVAYATFVVNACASVDNDVLPDSCATLNNSPLHYHRADSNVGMWRNDCTGVNGRAPTAVETLRKSPSRGIIPNGYYNGSLPMVFVCYGIP